MKFHAKARDQSQPGHERDLTTEQTWCLMGDQAGRAACSEFWGLGFLLGMQHALEADHIAAVSSIAARRTHVGDIVKHGLTWGLGHTLTLFAFAGAAILLGRAIPERSRSRSRPRSASCWSGSARMCCGGCGATACIFTPMAMATARCISMPTAIAGETAPHARAAHAHAHGFRWRTLLVGLMHGMAGSAALLMLAVSQAASPASGLGYVALFGIGSMVGMAALSSVIAVPLAASARWLTWANRGLQGAVGPRHSRDRHQYHRRDGFGLSARAAMCRHGARR